MSKNIWKDINVGDVYEALKSMTPEERLKDLYNSQQKLCDAISKSLDTNIKGRIFEYIDNHLNELKPEYEDYSFPYKVMLDDSEDIIHDMIETEEFYSLLKEYMKEVLWRIKYYQLLKTVSYGKPSY